MPELVVTMKTREEELTDQFARGVYLLDMPTLSCSNSANATI